MPTHSLTPLQQALEILQVQTQPLPAVSRPLTDALHSVLAQSYSAPEDIPPFSRSAMDGYALGAPSDTTTYHITGDTHAGETYSASLTSGQCIRIATGAPVPDGTTRVIPKELAQESPDRQQVTFESVPDVSFIRQRGEDAKQGDTLLPAGSSLTAGNLSLLASIGVTDPAVYPLPLIAHLTTGNELVAPDQGLKPGQIRDSNSTLVRSFLATHHFELQHQSRASDQEFTISDWIEVQSKSADVLLISGGASVGPRDFPPQLLQDAGFSCEFFRLNLRPGKPAFFGKRNDTYAFVLPGNPGSHLTVLRLVVLPLLQILSSRSSDIPRLAAALKHLHHYTPDQRHTFLPGHLQWNATGFEVSLNPWQSSGDVVSLTGANCLVEIPSDQALPSAGASVNCIPLYDFSLG